jgi:hypothetical protein
MTALQWPRVVPSANTWSWLHIFMILMGTSCWAWLTFLAMYNPSRWEIFKVGSSRLLLQLCSNHPLTLSWYHLVTGQHKEGSS